MEQSMLFLIIGMALATYLPRLLPLALLQNLSLPSYMIRFMRFIPYAALASLIFPGIVYSTGELHEAALAGALISIVLAYFEVNLLLVVLGGIAGALLTILQFT